MSPDTDIPTREAYDFDAYYRRSREQSGVPPHLEDANVLRKVARLVRESEAGVGRGDQE